MSNYIYTVTAITKDAKGPFSSRCFGFFFNESAARIAAINNHGGMNECLYCYLVIEKQGPGIHARAEPIQWYRWVGEHELSDGEEGCWIECERPNSEKFACIVNWNNIG